MLGLDAFTLGYLMLGALLVLMSLSHSYIARLPLSAALLYLLAGWGMGPTGLGLVHLDALAHAHLLERLAEVAVIVSLFVAGMKLDLPLRDRRWRVPVALASLSMLVTVAALAALGTLLLDMPLGLAVLLGAVLAPTDPVLASDVQLADAGDRDRLRFGLTGEGGLNDGSAFPMVMLGLGLLGLHDLGAGGWRWWLVDVMWATVAGLAIGALIGTAVGRAVLYLRVHHREAWGADEFIALGLIALSYGLALACAAYGFLAVFAAGLALGRIDRPGHRNEVAMARPAPVAVETGQATAQPPSPMAQVKQFNLQLERLAEVGVVLTVGLLLSQVSWTMHALWLVPVLLLGIRPLAVVCALVLLGRRSVDRVQAGLMAWFGIRGIGSIYYLMYAIGHGLPAEQAHTLVSLTLSVIVSSMALHGISVTPLMRRYEARQARGRSGTTQR